MRSEDDRAQLRELVRKLLDEESSDPAVRTLMQTERGYDPEVWRRMGEEVGLLGLLVPEAHGGSGLGSIELALACEEMGRALLCAPFLASAVLGAGSVLHCGDERARADLLPGIAAGERIATLACEEPGRAWDDRECRSAALRDGDGYRLHGVKSPVLDGHVADLLLVEARSEMGISLFRVAPDAPGLVRTPLPAFDPTRKLARLEFDAAPAELIGPEGSASEGLARVRDLALVALASEQVGGAQRCLEMAVGYARERIQFGRPIGSFQAVKHRCADLLVRVEAARSAAYHAARCADEIPGELPGAASMAKSFCSETYVAAAGDNLQIHGGIGFTWEHAAHLYLKRAKSSELLFGDPVLHRERLARLLGI